jgi:hypothetical protein
MMTPTIRTAIPKRRYQFGEFKAVALGDIQSNDAREYQYILALVVEGGTEPVLYVTAESNTEAEPGSHRMRVYTKSDGRDLGAADAWADLDRFTDAALEVASRILKLSDEVPQRLL